MYNETDYKIESESKVYSTNEKWTIDPGKVTAVPY